MDGDLMEVMDERWRVYIMGVSFGQGFGFDRRWYKSMSLTGN